MIMILNDLRMHIESLSYIDAMHSILTHRERIAYPKYILAGFTAMGFRFAVHRRLTADSLTTYNWVAEHFLAGDFIGMTSSQSSGFTFATTFPLYRKQAVEAIKASILDGSGALIWKDTFVIVVGFDDEKEIFYYCDGSGSDRKVLPFADFGCHSSPYWYYQVFEHAIALDEFHIVKESLVQAVNKWETHEPLLPEESYACGVHAYDAILDAYRAKDYDRTGAWEVMLAYAAAKRDIRYYTQTIAHLWPECQVVAAHYFDLAQLANRMEEIVQSGYPNLQIEPHQADKLIPLLMEAKETEGTAILCIRELMKETIDNRFHDIGLR